ncbi:hypothetical protein Hanom_Chr13g01206461 [Helianthus anomalus]
MESQQLFQALQRSQMEHMVQQQQQDMARRQAWEENEERLRIELNTREDRRWGAMDWEAGLPYAEHSGWTDYSNLPVPRGPSDPSPHWPEAVGSSFISSQFQPSADGEPGPLENYREMFEALTGFPYHPNPPVDPNERYQRRW